LKFTAEDIKDKELLMQLVKEEATRIFESERARKGRTYEQIEKSVYQGKVAELFLIENHGYLPADRKYHDLKDLEGNYTEVKAYRNASLESLYVKEDISRIKTGGWNDSKYYILFSFKEGVYELVEKINI
jgi:hypothetical protein